MIVVSCVHCGEPANQEACAESTDDGTDVSICFTCSGATIFTRCLCCGSAISRIPTAEETALIDTVPSVIIARQAIAENSGSMDAAVAAAWRAVRDERD